MSDQDVVDLLQGLPRFYQLQLLGCRVFQARGRETNMYTRSPLAILLLMEGIPTAILERLICPSLAHVRIDSAPPSQDPAFGDGESRQIIGAFIQRSKKPVCLFLFWINIHLRSSATSSRRAPISLAPKYPHSQL